jgi:hypothetical protein
MKTPLMKNHQPQNPDHLSDTITIRGKSYSCEQLVEGSCDNEYQQDFFKWGNNMDSYLTGELGMLGNRVIQPDQVKLGFIACEMMERGDTFEDYVELGQFAYPGEPRSSFAALYQAARERLCPELL